MFWVYRTLALISALALSDPAGARLEKALNAHGGKEAFYRLRDLQWTATRKTAAGVHTAVERFLFEGEKSLTDGVTDAQLRANYFWATFPFKFQDAGVVPTLSRPNSINVTFKPGTGRNSDTYRLFINPKSNLIDRVLFTRIEPLPSGTFVMTCRYEEVSGIQICIDRTTFKARQDGTPTGPAIETVHLDHVRFWNGFRSADFKP